MFKVLKKVRKMKNKVLMGLAAFMMVALLSSCGKVPQVQVDAAKAAVESAKVAQADIYVPAEYAAVQDSLNAVNASIEAKKSKWFKNYKVEQAKLEAIVVTVAQVNANAATKKEEVKKETETLLTDVNTVIADNKTLITKAPRGKEGKAVLDEITSEMTIIEASVAEAKGMYDKGDYMMALDKVKAAKAQADAINTELKDAIAKAKKR
jgi:hypothetical protein